MRCLAALKPGIATALLAKKFTPGLRVVARIDTPLEREHVEATRMKRRLGLAAVECLLPGADAVVALGARMAEDIEKHARGSRVEVIPNPVDVDRLVRTRGSRWNTRGLRVHQRRRLSSRWVGWCR